jgi:hypothetical protein
MRSVTEKHSARRIAEETNVKGVENPRVKPTRGAPTSLRSAESKKLMREGVNHPRDGHADSDEHQERPSRGARAFFGIAAMQRAQGQRRQQREEDHQLEVGEFHVALMFGGR